MSPRRIGRRWLASFVLGTVAPLVFAQMTPPSDAGAHGRGGGIATRPDCREHADERRLPAVDPPKSRMRRCLGTNLAVQDAAGSTATDPRAGGPASAPLHGDAPAAAPPGPWAT